MWMRSTCRGERSCRRCCSRCSKKRRQAAEAADEPQPLSLARFVRFFVGATCVRQVPLPGPPTPPGLLFGVTTSEHLPCVRVQPEGPSSSMDAGTRAVCSTL